MQRREWKLGLGLDAACTQDVHVKRALASIYEEGCLADARLASDDDCPALRRPCPVEQLTDCCALLVTPEEDGCLRRCGAHQAEDHATPRHSRRIAYGLWRLQTSIVLPVPARPKSRGGAIR